MSKNRPVKVTLPDGRGTKVVPGHSQPTRNIAEHMSAIDARRDAGTPGAQHDHPPINSAKVPQSAVKAEHFHAGHGDTHGGMNGEPPPRPAVGLEGDKATRDSPVPERDRQMPDKGVTTKAAEVAAEIRKHGDGEGFPPGGSMGGR